MSPSLDCKLLEGKSKPESSEFFAQSLAHSLVNDPKGAGSGVYKEMVKCTAMARVSYMFRLDI